MRNSRPKIAIVGAGPGGLASALLLSRTGADVRIFERNSDVGGRTSTISADGFHFDVGPTFFLYPRILKEIYAAAGRDLMKEVPMIRLDPQYRLAFGAGGQLDATPDVPRMERELAKICPVDAARFSRFLADNREKLERFRPCLETPFLSWADVFSPRMLRLLPILRPWRSLDVELGSYFSDARLRLAFSFQSKYLGMSPFRCPSLFSILAFLEYDAGVYHPIGGCGAVTRSMARVAKELGVSLSLNDPAEEILFAGKRATGIRTASGVYDADAVIINGDFGRAVPKLIPERLRKRWNDKTVASKKYSCSTFMMYLGIEGRYDDAAHHTIYVAKDYERNLHEIEIGHTLSEDPSVYVQNAGVTDPTLAPRGMSTLYVLVPVTHQHSNVDWSIERERYRAVALRQLGKIGIKDVERRIRFERIITPDDWDTRFEIYRGATFNLAHNLGQMLHLRPHNRFDDVERVYLTGGGTHPGSGLPVIFESARISSRLLAEDLGLNFAAPARTEEEALSHVA
jgi:phytoene desaturase